MADPRKIPTNYYKLFHRRTKEWLIISFDFIDTTVADHILKSLIQYEIHWERISQQRFLDYGLRFFEVYRIGAIRFDVGSRDPVRCSMFFKHRFNVGYVCSSQTRDGVYARFQLPFSKEKENLRRILEGMEDCVLPLWELLELHP